MTDVLKLIECPRDAWQGLPGQIPTSVKVEYLKALVAAGFKHIDAVSFVSPKAIPQMADSETVMSELDPPDDVEIIAIVVNERGAERAIATDAVRTVGFPYSLSPTFLKNNQNQTLEENLDILEKVKEKADEGGLDTIAYSSMAVGNPYGTLWNADELIEGISGGQVTVSFGAHRLPPPGSVLAGPPGLDRRAVREVMRGIRPADFEDARLADAS